MIQAFRLLLIMAIPLAASGADLDRALFIALSSSLVKIEASGSNGYAIGTGVAIAPGRVVTNCHVTRNAERIHVGRGGMRQPVVAQLPDLDHDVCLLHVPGLEAKSAPVGSSTALKLGQRVGALGFEGGVGLQFRQGVVKALHRHDGAKVVQSTTAFTSGASGGGLFDERGQLVGLLTFRLRGADGNYFSVPVEWFARNIENAARYGTVTPLRGQRPFWQRDREALPFFMQANSLQVDRQWVELLRLANRWATADKASSEPWLAQAKAYVGLARDDVALDAYQKALALDPYEDDAWYGLGALYARRGDFEKANQAEAKLRALNAGLAADLSRQISALQRSTRAPKI
jgi:serine protease Do